MLDAPDTSVAPGEFSFAFAKRHQVLLVRSEDASDDLFYSDATKLSGLTEARRFVGQDVTLVHLSADDFERDLTIKVSA